MATGATLYLVNSGDVDTSLAYAVQNTINGITIPIISQSYGGCEAAQNSTYLKSEEPTLAQANSQGQTMSSPPETTERRTVTREPRPTRTPRRPLGWRLIIPEAALM